MKLKSVCNNNFMHLLSFTLHYVYGQVKIQFDCSKIFYEPHYNNWLNYTHLNIQLLLQLKQFILMQTMYFQTGFKINFSSGTWKKKQEQTQKNFIIPC